MPLDLGGNRRGVDMGPSAFRIAGLGERIASLGYAVVDKGDLPAPIPETQEQRDERKKYIRDIAQGLPEAVPDRAARRSTEGAMPLVLGGDHSLGAGSVAARGRAGRRRTRELPIGLLWVDAHGDMNTPATSLSGNVHGMPLAALLGPEPAELARIGGVHAEGAAGAHRAHRRAQPRRAREGRRARLARARLHDEGHRPPGHRVDRRAGGRISPGNGTAGIHVSFDMDVCDPPIAPGVGTPVKGGLDYREAHMVMEIVADSGLLTSLDLVEVNPTLDVRNATAQLGTELVLSALGMKIL